MTMQHTAHPDDERLAAYAGGDREAVSDREVAAHIDGCERCRPIVDELTVLHDALALLPDIAPARPLRLIPPVAGPAARRSGALEWLRRLAAPAMAAGAGLVLVGAVGISGIGDRLASTAAGAPTPIQESSSDAGAPVEGGPDSSPIPATSTDGSFTGRTNTPGSQGSGDSAAPTPSAGRDLVHLDDRAAGEPWLTLLIAGSGLFGIAAILRYSLTPRAG